MLGNQKIIRRYPQKNVNEGQRPDYDGIAMNGEVNSRYKKRDEQKFIPVFLLFVFGSFVFLVLVFHLLGVNHFLFLIPGKNFVGGVEF